MALGSATGAYGGLPTRNPSASRRVSFAPTPQVNPYRNWMPQQQQMYPQQTSSLRARDIRYDAPGQLPPGATGRDSTGQPIYPGIPKGWTIQTPYPQLGIGLFNTSGAANAANSGGASSYQTIFDQLMGMYDVANKPQLNSLQDQLNELMNSGKVIDAYYNQKQGSNAEEIRLKKMLEDLFGSDTNLNIKTEQEKQNLINQLVAYNDQRKVTNLGLNDTAVAKLNELTDINLGRADTTASNEQRRTLSDATARGAVTSEGFQSDTQFINKMLESTKGQLETERKRGLEQLGGERKNIQTGAEEQYSQYVSQFKQIGNNISKLYNDLERVGINKAILDTQLKDAMAKTGIDQLLASISRQAAAGNISQQQIAIANNAIQQAMAMTPIMQQYPELLPVVTKATTGTKPTPPPAVTSQRQTVIAPSRPGENKMT